MGISEGGAKERRWRLRRRERAPCGAARARRRTVMRRSLFAACRRWAPPHRRGGLAAAPATAGGAAGCWRLLQALQRAAGRPGRRAAGGRRENLWEPAGRSGRRRRLFGQRRERPRALGRLRRRARRATAGEAVSASSHLCRAGAGWRRPWAPAASPRLALAGWWFCREKRAGWGVLYRPMHPSAVPQDPRRAAIAATTSSAIVRSAACPRPPAGGLTSVPSCRSSD